MIPAQKLTIQLVLSINWNGQEERSNDTMLVEKIGSGRACFFFSIFKPVDIKIASDNEANGWILTLVLVSTWVHHPDSRQISWRQLLYRTKINPTASAPTISLLQNLKTQIYIRMHIQCPSEINSMLLLLLTDSYNWVRYEVRKDDRWVEAKRPDL